MSSRRCRAFQVGKRHGRFQLCEERMHVVMVESKLTTGGWVGQGCRQASEEAVPRNPTRVSEAWEEGKYRGGSEM